MLNLIFIIIAILLAVAVWRPSIDFTRDGNVLLWYNSSKWTRKFIYLWKKK